MGAKGSQFERDNAKFLTKWVSGKEKPYIYWRTPSSGAMATLSEENKELSGDLHAIRIEGAFLTDRFSIELKTGYTQASFDKHLKCNKSDPIESFWNQCVIGALMNDKHPMLIYRKKGMSTVFLGVTPIILDHFNELVDLRSVTLNFGKDSPLPTLIFFDRNAFFDTIGPDRMKQL